MFDVSLMAAFGAGLLSFASPCVLPIVPFYLSYLAGVGLNELKAMDALDRSVQRRAIISALFFSAGMITIFVGMGAAASGFGVLVREWFAQLRWVAALIIIVMGLHFLGVLKIGILYKQFKIEAGDTQKISFAMAFVLGLAFAFGWTPCVGPILAAILFTAASSDTVGAAMQLLFAYGLGMTSPFIIASLFVAPFLRWAQSFRRHLGRIEKITGALLVLFGMLIASDSVSVIANWMLQAKPDLWTFG
ncbi:cytochrome c biogenesis protein CcdA [Paracoccaceae bacterium]|nr:cytochrome c biogenesis protein CcdA [Paracoccaceae bacterium]